MYALTVRVPDQPVRKIRVEKPVTTLGRSSSSDLPLLDKTLSRMHARIELKNGELFVCDLESRNGTLVNGVRISGLTKLKTGDTIMVGETRIDVSESTAPHVVLDFPDDGSIMERTVFRSSTDLLDTSKRHTRTGLDANDLVRLNTSLEILYEVSKKLLSNEPVGKVMQILMDSIFDHLSPDRGLLMVYDEANNLKPEVVKFAKEIDPGDIRLSRTLVHEVVDKNNGFLSIDTLSDVRLGSADSIRLQGITSCMAAPVTIGDKVLGLIYLEARMGRKSFNEDDLRLLAALANAAAIKIENVRLQEAEAARVRIEREMTLAWDVQRRLLPESAPDLPETELFGRTIPSRTVSGDYYDFFLDPAGALYVVVADVCGKGMAASILAASVQAAFQAWASEGFSPGELCFRLNEMVVRRTSPEKFVTLFSALYDPATGGIRFCNAGHNPGVVLRANGTTHLLESHGMPLGLFPGQNYPSDTIKLNPGDLAVLYSDGIVEACDPEYEEFGIERLIQSVAERGAMPLEDIANGVIGELQAFVRGVPFADDRTLVLVRRS